MAVDLTQIPNFDQLPVDTQVGIANLTEAGQQQMVNMATSPDFDGNYDSLLLHGQVADGAREQADDLRQEAQHAVERGDFAEANDLYRQDGYAVQAVEGQGGEGDPQLVQAQKDEMDTDYANFHQETAHEDAVSAVSYAQSGDLDTAANYASSAGSEASTAADMAAPAAEPSVASVDYSHADTGETSV